MRDYTADIAYRTRQAEKGLRQLSVWVPGDLQIILVELAGIARTLPVHGEGQAACLDTLVADVRQLLKDYRHAVPVPPDGPPAVRGRKRRRTLETAEQKNGTTLAEHEEAASEKVS